MGLRSWLKRHVAETSNPAAHVTSDVILELERVATAFRATNAAVEEQLRLTQEEEKHRVKG